MARDNPPHARQAAKLARRGPQRQPYDRILIVCEGEKTEPQYFQELCHERKLSSANIHIIPSALGTAPKQIVECAIKTFNEKKREFERVYAVFDRDAHPSYHDALRLVKDRQGKLKSQSKEPVLFDAVVSIPCFELWLVLHFERLSHRVSRFDTQSRLKRYLPNYSKGSGGHWASTKVHLPTAKQNATHLKSELGHHRNQNEDPYTDVHELVDVLLNLKKAP